MDEQQTEVPDAEEVTETVTTDADATAKPSGPPPSTYDPSRVLAIGRVSTARLDEIARSFAERCASTKELPRPEQLRNLLVLTRVANCEKLLPRFTRVFWTEMSRRSGVSVAELKEKAGSLPDLVPPPTEVTTETQETDVTP